MFKRGFGDSTEVSDIRETTVVEDAHRALGYLRDTIGATSVIVWGHSQVLMIMMAMPMINVLVKIMTTLMIWQGAAIATHMMAQADLKTMEKVKL